MGANTKIEWCDFTFNPWRGCQKVAPGCANCYAETLSKRNPGTLGAWGPSGTRVVASEAMWRQPIKWDRESAQREESYRIAAMTCRSEYDIVEAPERPRVFCASLADVFEDWRGPVIRRQSELAVCHGCGNFGSLAECIDCGGGDALCSRMPRKATLDDVRARLFRLIDATPNLDWLLLTKRPENVRQMLPRVDCVVYRDGDDGLRTIGIDDEDRGGALRQYRSNVWLGVSIACQDDADRLIPELLKCRALCANTFLSIEPLLDDIDIRKWLTWELDVDEARPPGHFTRRITGIDWVIIGGESGPNARPCNVAWIRSIVRQCRDAGVSPYVKQAGAHVIDSDLISRCSWPGLTNFQFDRVLLRDRKGGDPAEWPEDLRVREVPT